MTAKSKKKLLIVDGYNVIRVGNFYQESRQRMPDFSDDAFNAAREALINDVALFAGHEYRPLIVFDAAENSYSNGQSTNVGGIEVIYSPAGESADSLIERRAKQAAQSGWQVLVVTSDAATQWTVMGTNVTRMSAAEFFREMQLIHDETSLPTRLIAEKNTLGDRLSADVLAELRRRFG